MTDRKRYTLTDLQRMREEMELSHRLDDVAHEHRMRQLLGDDVYDFMTGGPRDPVARAYARVADLARLAEQLTAPRED